MTPFTLHVEPPIGPPLTRQCERGPLVFGRSAESDVVCSDSSMSRRHAQVVVDGDRCFVEDLGARNGTFVNGTRIEGRAPFQPGDIIRMGATVVRLQHPEHAGMPGAGMPGAAAPGGATLGDERLGTTIFRPIRGLAGDRSEPDSEAVDPARLTARLKAVNDFHRALGQAVALDALLELLFDQLFAVLQPEEGVILLRQADGTLKTAASRRLPGATGELLISQRLVAEVIEKNAAALVTDIEYDARFNMAHSVVAAGVRGILAAPFTDADGCVGMVAVYSRTRIRKFTEDDLELLVSLAAAAALRIRNVALAEQAAARLVQDRELALASEIQMGMLPRALPHRPEVDLAARLIPARAVGGDLYDFVVLGDDLWFIVADAAGKGVSAALFMAMTRTLFRAVARAGGDVAAVVARMNTELARDNERQVFVTAIVARLSLATGALAWCNAGHHPILRLRADGAVEPLPKPATGVALGVVDDVVYEEASAAVAPGEMLVIYTDGVTEAIDATGALFSDDRLFELLATQAARPAAEVVEEIVAAVNRFASGTPQEDDITVMALMYRG